MSNWSKLKRGYLFGQPTTYSKHHLGLDLIAPKGTPVFAPFDGHTTKIVGKQGGNTVWFYWDKLIMRVMHLSAFGKIGKVKEGDIIGYVGSTGSLSTGNHAHIDISKKAVNIANFSNFLDPEKYQWEKPKQGTTIAQDEEKSQSIVEIPPTPQTLLESPPVSAQSEPVIEQVAEIIAKEVKPTLRDRLMAFIQTLQDLWKKYRNL